MTDAPKEKPYTINIHFDGWDPDWEKWTKCMVAIYPDDVQGADYTRTDIHKAEIKRLRDQVLEEAAQELDRRAAQLHRVMQYYASERLQSAAAAIRAMKGDKE